LKQIPRDGSPHQFGNEPVETVEHQFQVNHFVCRHAGLIGGMTAEL